MSNEANPPPTAAFAALGANVFRASELTRGPWHPQQQHASPPIALVCQALVAAAQPHGLLLLARLTANLLRPVPIGDIEVCVQEEYVGRNSIAKRMDFANNQTGYPDLMETRLATGCMFGGPSAVFLFSVSTDTGSGAQSLPACSCGR